ncbi:MAG TPA: cell division protein ZapA [Thermoanaerobaculia bacterium]|nr:cell division protein ZapA [Thermoanaerobaculia bacterium]
MAESRANVTQVEIYGQTYTVRAESDSSYVRELARYVDGKMREVAERAATVDSAKIAILAALNISDDLYQRDRRGQGDPANARARVERLIKKLDDALEAR